ncbi:hypothetical protein [Streptomyces sp. NPDC097981]|uniref:hypothetical protein n=1 Tax=Streptomyces sp. NPDC097981 TaxID=3155428 RepID=UPI003316B76B
MGIQLYAAIPIAAVVLLLACSGTAVLTRGWMLPVQRRHIVRPALFGWAQLLLAGTLAVQLTALLVVDAAYRPVAFMPASAGMLFALVLVQRARHPHLAGRDAAPADAG